MMPLEYVMQGAYRSIKDALTVAEFKWVCHECTNAYAAHFSLVLADAPAVASRRSILPFCLEPAVLACKGEMLRQECKGRRSRKRKV